MSQVVSYTIATNDKKLYFYLSNPTTTLPPPPPPITAQSGSAYGLALSPPFNAIAHKKSTGVYLSKLAGSRSVLGCPLVKTQDMINMFDILGSFKNITKSTVVTFSSRISNKILAYLNLKWLFLLVGNIPLDLIHKSIKSVQ